ncbi:MAG: type II toxin-antitoxin system RelE/ParE family toxin [Dehalococcoidia bacterium]|nr:MAG: type II toxin-antitoxin system RelE/ParE family toxin [Dehalococcoidia bacterium]
MAYRVDLRPKAQRQLDALPARYLERVAQAIEDLCNNPRPSGTKKLSGNLGWRLRIGEYRVLYTIWGKERRVMIDAVTRRTTTTYD